MAAGAETAETSSYRCQKRKELLLSDYCTVQYWTRGWAERDPTFMESLCKWTKSFTKWCLLLSAIIIPIGRTVWYSFTTDFPRIRWNWDQMKDHVNAVLNEFSFSRKSRALFMMARSKTVSEPGPPRLHVCWPTHPKGFDFINLAYSI